MPEQTPPTRSPQKVMTLIGCAMLVTALAVSGIALAHNQRFNSTITFTSAVKSNPGKALFRGAVNSGKPACKNNREVQVFRVGNPDIRIGRGFTVASGAWKIKGNRPAQGATIYALVEAKALPPNNHNHACDVDFSPQITFPHP